MKFSTPLFKAFSGGHGHGHDDHGDGHGHEEVHVQSHQPKYDRVAYNTQLKRGEREPIPDVDWRKDQTADFIPLTGEKKSIHRTNVMIPKEQVDHFLDCLMDRTEIEARIYNLLRQFDFMDLDQFDFEKPVKDQGLDSLEWIALMTSVEHEFHTAFEDNLYDHYDKVADLVTHLANDHLAF